jgi:F-type H+-transporting ATPase subunit delta
MAKLNKVVSSYARALHAVAGGGEASQKVASELAEFGRWLGESKELRMVCSSVRFSAEQRSAVVNDLAAKAKFSDVTKKALAVLSKSNRLLLADAVAEKLRRLALEDANVAPLQVESAEELDEATRRAVVKRFENLLGKKVDARFTVVQELLGGVRVVSEGRTYDGSLKGQLSRLGERLAGGW